jgi:hypothetical protein
VATGRIVFSFVFVSVVVIIVVRMMISIVLPLICEVRVAVIGPSIRRMSRVAITIVTEVVHATGEADAK